MILFVLQLIFGRCFNISKNESKELAIEKVNVAKISLFLPKDIQVPALRNHEAVMTTNRQYQKYSQLVSFSNGPQLTGWSVSKINSWPQYFPHYSASSGKILVLAYVTKTFQASNIRFKPQKY